MMVSCVLKSGKEYTPYHVHNLRDMCKDFLPAHTFVCLSDVPVECDRIPLVHGWSGWWSKLELFKLDGPCLYFDLDTILVNDCIDIVNAARGKDFVILRDFYRGEWDINAMGSGMMYWEKPLRFLYDKYRSDEEQYPGGDQALIEDVMQDKMHMVSFWQDICTGIVSYKAHDRHLGLQPTDKVVCFHGQPRPWGQTRIAYPFRK